jgi:hypothetical protein
MTKIEAMNLGVPRPPITSPLTILVGGVCQRCLRHERDMIDKRVRQSAQPAAAVKQAAEARARAKYALTASAFGPNFHHPNRCGVCNKWVVRARTAMRAHMGLPPLRSHQPTPRMFSRRATRVTAWQIPAGQWVSADYKPVVQEFVGRDAITRTHAVACGCKSTAPASASCIKGQAGSGPCNCAKCKRERSLAVRR